MGSQGGEIQEPMSSPLGRQGFLYNLTVQNQLGNLGKPLGGMNFDELLKSVWSAEAGDFGGGGDANNMQQQHGQLASGGSSLNPTLSEDLSKKTVEEVWRDMQLKKSVNRDRKTEEQRPTLGEMTLEDFFMKAGVVAESFHTEDGAMSGVDLNRASSRHGHWMQYQLSSMQRPPQQNSNMMGGYVAGHAIQQPFQVAGNLVVDAVYSETPPSLMGTLSDTQTPGRKRVASGHVVEKTVERRQKRMIKNRESAARSRARKQAYTQELENKILLLEEENKRLRRLNEIERALPSVPPPEPKHQLCRTSSATF